MTLWIGLLILLIQVGNIDAAVDVTGEPHGTTEDIDQTTGEPGNDTTGQPSDFTTGGIDTTAVTTSKQPQKEECTVETCKDGSKVTCSLNDGDCECEACPTCKEVKFEFRATITEDEFNTHKATMTEEMADLLDVHKKNVELALKTAKKRRALNEGIDIEVTVKTEDEAGATEVENKVQDEAFKADLGESLSDITGSAVTIAEISKPMTIDIKPSEPETSTAAPEEESNSNTVIIIVVVAAVVLLMCGCGFALYKYTSDGEFFDHKGGIELADNDEFQFR